MCVGSGVRNGGQKGIMLPGTARREPAQVRSG